MMDRADAAGLGIAAALHVALLAALILLVPTDPIQLPRAPTMEISYEEEVGLVSAGETTEARAPGSAPEEGPPEEAAPVEALPEPLPAPVPPQPPAQPQPQAQAQPTPQAQPRPAPRAPAPQARPQPQQRTATPPRPQAPQQRTATPPRQQPQRQSGNGNRQTSRGPLTAADLKLPPAETDGRSNRPAGAVMNSQAQANIASLIQQQVRPCANRQRSPGPGAERIRVTIRLRINRDGSLAAPPTVVGRTGVDDDNSRYAERVDDLAINTFTACSPLRGLPDELYDVPNGWRDFRLRYNLLR
jgi:outer membrane biosynthesis protein TonB